MASRNRFFGAAVHAGRLHIRGIPAWGPWDPARLEWATEAEIDPSLVEAAGERKIRTREELATILREAKDEAPTRFVWIHESLADDVRALWKRMATELKQ